jgi:hypothetical protein
MVADRHDERTRAQLAMLERMAALDPPARIMGGYAEDAVVGGRLSRPHDDIDVAVLREELPLRLDQLGDLGFGRTETWGESAPGEPFYLYAQGPDGLSIDLGVFDHVDGHPVMDVASVAFTIEGGEPWEPFRVHLPSDAFAAPAAAIEDVPVWPLSTLALYQVRVGIASRAAFGALTDKQRHSLGRLRSLFPDVTDEGLMPEVTPLNR